MDKRSKNNNNNFHLIVLTVACVTAVCSVFALGFSIYNYNNSSARVTWNGGTDGNSTNFTDGSIADVANKVSPSVVSITTETRTTGWFGQSSTSTAAGTGMIVSSDGYVLTNKRVVEGANKVNVILDDGTAYENVKVDIVNIFSGESLFDEATETGMMFSDSVTKEIPEGAGLSIEQQEFMKTRRMDKDQN